MFSKKEKQILKTEFWTTFGKAFPRNWILYDTKIKDFSFKFYADEKFAEVSLQISSKDEIIRKLYFEKMLSLENYFLETIPNLQFQEDVQIESGKFISKIWIVLENVSILDKNSWHQIFPFFVKNMEGLEKIFLDFEDYIRAIEP